MKSSISQNPFIIVIFLNLNVIDRKKNQRFHQWNGVDCTLPKKNGLRHLNQPTNAKVWLNSCFSFCRTSCLHCVKKQHMPIMETKKNVLILWEHLMFFHNCSDAQCQIVMTTRLRLCHVLFCISQLYLTCPIGFLHTCFPPTDYPCDLPACTAVPHWLIMLPVYRRLFQELLMWLHVVFVLLYCLFKWAMFVRYCSPFNCKPDCSSWVQCFLILSALFHRAFPWLHVIWKVNKLSFDSRLQMYMYNATNYTRDSFCLDSTAH